MYARVTRYFISGKKLSMTTQKLMSFAFPVILAVACFLV